MQLSQKFTALKRAVLRGVTNVPEVEAVLVEDASLGVMPTVMPSRPLPIYLSPECHVACDPEHSERSSSPATSYEPSLFSQPHTFTSADLTSDPTSLSPLPVPSSSLKRNAIGSWFDVVVASNDSYATNADPEFEEFLRNTQEKVDRKMETIKAAKRKALWENLGVVPASPPAVGFTVIVPGISKSLTFGAGMLSAESHTYLLPWIAEKSGMKPSSGKGIVLVSEIYPHEITDCKSYEAWVAWMTGRDAVDRVLCVM